MKKYLIINKKTNKVVAFSDSLNEVDDKFEQKEVDITSEDFSKLEGPNESFFTRNAFTFKPLRPIEIDKEAIKNKLQDSSVSIEEKFAEINKIIDLI